MTAFKTWEEMSELEQAQAIWWDAFKDANGYRPRGIDTSEWTLTCFKTDIIRLGEIIALQETENAKQQAVATVKFEQRVQKIINDGAKDRDTAMRWIHEAEGSNGDDDYLCYLVGIPYGYFNNTHGVM
ncbi:hypothetical protein UFOVP116_354 [uncultured Caudovirales phage]|uniref:Uncharacterized protein n=1 Tax=uncultured Caudovirales phage TaxID=2100421 RepID=A0A6J5LF66_9CAUD|nr:hypothetical protein UFOVP116_354 [uncultured Caudovirales phage]